VLEAGTGNFWLIYEVMRSKEGKRKLLIMVFHSSNFFIFKKEYDQRIIAIEIMDFHRILEI
jgi:hypothetical protein